MFNNVHHVFTKSIAGFQIFRKESNFERMIQTIYYYQFNELPMSFSNFVRSALVQHERFNSVVARLALERNWSKRVDILAYCLMNTHLHLIVKENQIGGLSSYMSDILNSYSRFFNKAYERKGPLWQSRFGRFSIVGKENLLSVASYVHLNPVKASLVHSPHQWPYSSFKTQDVSCSLLSYLEMSLEDYCNYVQGQASKNNLQD